MIFLGGTSGDYLFQNSSFTKTIVEILAFFRLVLRFYYRLVGTIMLYESSPAVTRLTVYRGLQVNALRAIQILLPSARHARPNDRSQSMNRRALLPDEWHAQKSHSGAVSS